MTAQPHRLLDRNRLELGPGSGESQWRHWSLGRDDNDIAWLLLDRRDRGANALSEEVLEELDAVLGELEARPPRALVIRSAKASGFCVGADVAMFRGVTDVDEAMPRLRRAHDIVDRLDSLPFTTVAVIHGPCLGGGLELALACDHRIAIAGATFGFPEVMLGLHPGMGGTFRAPALGNPLAILPLMLTGKSVPAGKARGLGLVDAVTEERHIAAAVADAAAGKLAGPRPSRLGALLKYAWPRRLAAARMEAATASKVARSQYPAPFALIDLWRQRGGDPKAMQAGEIRSFAGLVTSDKGQNLVRVFFLRETLKGQGDKAAADIRHVHVVGAGTMGGDIAAWCALRGFTVTLGDMEPEMIAGAVARARDLCRRKRLDRGEQRAVLDRLVPDLAGDGVPRADLVIEAVPEKIDIKRQVYQDLEARMKPDAILATNTSSIPLEELRQEVRATGRFLGLHFFNPVAKMQLVELVHHDDVHDSHWQRALDFTVALDRLPVPVKSAPGFLVNRVLTPYLLEAMLMLDEGVAPRALDRAAVAFGMPMGTVELADQVGLDICIAVGDMLRERLGGDMPEVPKWIRDKVEAGNTGRKSGRGFYPWKGGQIDKKAEKQTGDDAPADAANRLILPMLNACVACLREEVVADAEVLDGAVIFGTGFAPFRGGPIHYARHRGVDEIVSALEKLAEARGPRFTPDAGWQQLK